jgi:hypothetical protein
VSIPDSDKRDTRATTTAQPRGTGFRWLQLSISEFDTHNIEFHAGFESNLWMLVLAYDERKLMRSFTFLPCHFNNLLANRDESFS